MRLFKFAGYTSVVVAAALAIAVYQHVPAAVPEANIAASVVRTAPLLDRAWQLPVAATFNRRVDSQSNLSVCGPSSLANVFRSLSERPVTESDVLAGTGLCPTGFCVSGLTLDELAQVASRHTDRTVTVLRDLTPSQFLEHLRHTNEPGRRYVVNFRRREIFGSGGGHFSPIAGYLENEDLVFVLDVNDRFKPWLIERSRLYAAMNTLDGTKKRGLLLIE